MSHQPFSRADRNRIRRGQRSDRPRTPAARFPWASNVMRRENPGPFMSVNGYMKLIYDERDVSRIASRLNPLFRHIGRRVGKGTP